MVALRKDAPDVYEARCREVADDPRTLEQYLSTQGVSRAVVLPELHPFNNFNVTTEMVVEYCKESERLIPFVNLNPKTDGDLVGRLRYFVCDQDCKGLKLMPSYHHFYVNDGILYPIYAFAQEAGIPVMLHIGTSTFPHTKLKYCDPVLLDEVCVDFPELKVIASHGGRGFWYSAVFSLLNLHRNLYIDIAGLPPRRLLDYFPDLEKRADRFLFGSDWPTIPTSIGDNIRSMESLSISGESKRKILGGNAKQLLKL
jgi:hypothetical protein